MNEPRSLGGFRIPIRTLERGRMTVLRVLYIGCKCAVVLTVVIVEVVVFKVLEKTSEDVLDAGSVSDATSDETSVTAGGTMIGIITGEVKALEKVTGTTGEAIDGTVASEQADLLDGGDSCSRILEIYCRPGHFQIHPK